MPRCPPSAAPLWATESGAAGCGPTPVIQGSPGAWLPAQVWPWAPGVTPTRGREACGRRSQLGPRFGRAATRCVSFHLAAGQERKQVPKGAPQPRQRAPGVAGRRPLAADVWFARDLHKPFAGLVPDFRHPSPGGTLRGSWRPLRGAGCRETASGAPGPQPCVAGTGRRAVRAAGWAWAAGLSGGLALLQPCGASSALAAAQTRGPRSGGRVSCHRCRAVRRAWAQGWLRVRGLPAGLWGVPVLQTLLQISRGLRPRQRPEPAQVDTLSAAEAAEDPGPPRRRPADAPHPESAPRAGRSRRRGIFRGSAHARASPASSPSL